MPHTPKRIQRKRTKGWRMPEGAVYVGRPTKWGNPLQVSVFGEQAFELYRESFQIGAVVTPPIEEVRKHLRGKDLVCWCRLDRPCHADVLLEIANG